MLKILLSGACGRMGHQVANLAEEEGAVIAVGVDVHAESWGAFPVYPSFSLVREEAAQPVRLTLKARAEKKDTPGTDETRLVLMTGGSGRGPYALCALSLFAGAALLAGRRKRCRFSS